jgi:chromate transporter
VAFVAGLARICWRRDNPDQAVSEPAQPAIEQRASLATVAREWTRIGVTGFGGPPAHMALLRELMVARRHWMSPHEFQDAIAACNLLPGPASTQLSIFCAYRVAGPLGAIIGGLGFVVPAVAMILALSVVFLASSPPLWVRGAGAGAGAAVAAVAVQAARGLIGPSNEHVRHDRVRLARWIAYLTVGIVAAALIGAFLVLALVACGLAELWWQGRSWGWTDGDRGSLAALAPAPIASGGLGALAWTAFKVGALAFGGGFVIVPLMQSDAVHVYHWMTNAQFLNAVALGQVTPGPVVATVAAVGYAAHGLAGGLLAALVAFIPSFAFVLLGGRRFQRLRQNRRARAFLDGAGPAAIGAIIGAAITLAVALQERWQFAILAGAAVALLLMRRGVVETLLAAGVVGVVAALAGAPLP